MELLKAKGADKSRGQARAIRGLYPLAIYLMLVPVCDVIMRGIPLQTQNVAWRFALAGLLFANVGTILMGLALAGVIAVVAGDRMTLRVVASAALLGAVVIVGLLGLYSLDALQLRAAVNGPRAGMVLDAAVTAMGAAFLGMLGFVGVGMGGMSLLRSSAKNKKVQASLDATVPLYPTITGGLVK